MSKPPVYIDVIRERPPVIGRCPCGQRIEWVTTMQGRRMPLDHPVTVEAVFERDDGRTVASINASQSHFVTCPDADQYRKKRG